MKQSITLILPLLLPLISAQIPHWGPCPDPPVQSAFSMKKVSQIPFYALTACFSAFQISSAMSLRLATVKWKFTENFWNFLKLGIFPLIIIFVLCLHNHALEVNDNHVFTALCVLVLGKVVWGCKTAGSVWEREVHWIQLYHESRWERSCCQLRDTVSDNITERFCTRPLQWVLRDGNSFLNLGHVDVSLNSVLHIFFYVMLLQLH